MCLGRFNVRIYSSSDDDDPGWLETSMLMVLGRDV